MQKIVECGQVGKNVSTVKVLEQVWGIRLSEIKAGYEPAGSMARWVNDCYRVHWKFGDQSWSHAFKTLAEAYDFFALKISQH